MDQNPSSSEDFVWPDTTSAQKEAEKQRKDLSDTEVGLLRRRAKTNLYFLAKTILGYDKIVPGLHGNLCKWMDETRIHQFRLPLLPRAHFKTTIVTKADTIQIILPDDSGNQPHPRNLGTDARVCIGHEVVDQAASFLAEVTNKILFQPFLLALFPEIVPGKQHRVNKYQLELPRTKGWSEPTIDTIGVGTRGQGRHYDFIKADDTYGEEARDSPAKHLTTINWLGSLPGMLVSQRESHIDFPGTRYSKDDIYARIMEVYGEDIRKYIRPVWERNEKNERVLIFPEVITWKEIERLQKDPLFFNAQMMNNPMENIGEFEQEWERYFEWKDDRREEVIAADTVGIRKVHVEEMDRVLFLDPAMTGNCGIIVTGTDSHSPRHNVYCLDAIMGKFPTEKLIAEIFRLVEKWNPRVVVIESVLFSGLYQNLFKREMSVRNRHFRILPAFTKQKQKEDRVRVLRGWFANSQIFFHKSQEDLIEQYRYFGSIKEYHILDALAYGPEFWRASMGREESDRREDVWGRVVRSRESSTGYSAIRLVG